MKNVHLLLAGESYLSLNCSYRDSAIGTQVGKPYWTYSKDWKHHMSVTDASVRPHNIYITNDEEIKEGDWILENSTKILKWKMSYSFPSEMSGICKKIILTTDQDLIKDGVQAITDEFLEWFVKNPSCERVEIEESYSMSQSTYSGIEYEIIIPKEETKLQCKDCNDNLTDCTCIEDTIDMKQETLEEAAQRIFNGFGDITKPSAVKRALELVKWQQETTADYIDRHVVAAMVEVAKQDLYSKEDMKSSFQVGFNVGYNDEESPPYLTFEEWIKEYKKK